MHAVVGRAPDGDDWLIALTDSPRDRAAPERIRPADLAARVSELEERHAPRWTVRALRGFYPPLLDAGVRLRRAHDLTLCHAILRDTDALDAPLAAASLWARSETTDVAAPSPGLFDMDDSVAARGELFDEVREQWRAQNAALERAPDARLSLLCAAESTGALIAEEMTAAGLPWSTTVHEQILEQRLGPRPARGARPARMLALADQVTEHLNDPTANLDSPPRLLRALHRVGILVRSTSRWELAQIEHPAIAPLLEYKKLARLFAANGWSWLDEWIHDDRFRPVYLTGGVVTGRWASSGGGALQIPRQLRRAVHADPGWTLISADVAQLEPRMLAAMSRDTAMADAARGADLYEGIVRSGAVGSREEAKYAVLGAMYGATTGESGRLVPRLRTVFPRAMDLVDAAARVGEQGGAVSTVLGRSSPRPSEGWQLVQTQARQADAAAADETRARSAARERGRFTRNFVVQGTAAEWALLWLAEIRHRLWVLPQASAPASASGPVYGSRAHLAFFLHDEVIVHCPRELAETAAEAIRAAADAATARLFPGFTVDVPLDLHISEDAGKEA